MSRFGLIPLRHFGCVFEDLVVKGMTWRGSSYLWRSSTGLVLGASWQSAGGNEALRGEIANLPSFCARRFIASFDILGEPNDYGRTEPRGEELLHVLRRRRLPSRERGGCTSGARPCTGVKGDDKQLPAVVRLDLFKRVAD